MRERARIKSTLYATGAGIDIFSNFFKKNFLMPFDSSRRADHEYAKDFARRPKIKKVMGCRKSKIHRGDPFHQKYKNS
jgi:hypothetical protein